MFNRKHVKKLFPLFALTFLLYMCAGTGGDYSDWYAENPEEDLLGSMFGADATQDGEGELSQGPSDSNQSDDTFVANSEPQDGGLQQPNDSPLVAQDPVVDTPAPGGTGQSDAIPSLQGAPPANAYTMMGHVPEYRSEIFRESKVSADNKIELIVSNQIRIKSIDDSKWRPFNGAFVSAKDNQDLTVTYTSQRTDANGSFRVILQPADPYKFFSFVPFEEIYAANR